MAKRFCLPLKAVGLILVLFTVSLHGEASLPVAIPRLSGAITLDGLSNEPAWEGIAPLPLTTHSPVFGAPPAERTEIRLAYDDEYLYVGGRFYMADPNLIRGNSLLRDNLSLNDDNFTLLLDTFNDNESALIFQTTPAGARIDMTMANDARMYRRFPGNPSWNTFWDVEVVTNAQGWFMEMRIPFSSLRFQNAANRDEVVMGVTAVRFMAVHNEIVIYPAIEPRWALAMLKSSQAQDMTFTGIHPRKPLYLAPYFLGGSNQISALNSPGVAWELDRQMTGELGLDAKYSLTSNLTLDVTVNTDFAQVEADDERVNLTRFNLFYPEKRLFFQERSSIFQFSTGGFSGLFYSRRIGLSDYGPVPILGGARLVGRIGGWDVGILNMQTGAVTLQDDNNPVALPMENFGVYRVRRQVLNPYSYVGAMLTTRSGANTYDYAGGTDFRIRIFGDDYLSGKIIGDYNSELAPLLKSDTAYSLVDAMRMRFQWERRSNKGLSYTWSASHLGSLYDPQVGFEMRQNYMYSSLSLAYAIMPDERSAIFRIAPGFRWRMYRDNDRAWDRGLDALESIRGGPALSLEMKNGAGINLELEYNRDDLDDGPLELPGDAVVPAGRYHFTNLQAFISTPNGKDISAMTRIKAGQYYDGWLASVGIRPQWVLSRHITLLGGVTFNHGRFPARQEAFTANIFQLKTQFSLNTKLSASAFLQMNTEAKALGLNLRVRYNPREGTDLYLVYNEGFNTDRYREEPFLPLTGYRAVLLKYTTIFIW